MQKVEWSVYMREMRARFSENEYSDPMAELVSLKQLNFVEEYYEKFEALLNLLQLSDEYSLSVFVSNLKPEIANFVRLFQPRTLTYAFNLAKQVEAMIYNLPRKFIMSPKINQTNLHTTPKNLFMTKQYSP